MKSEKIVKFRNKKFFSKFLSSATQPGKAINKTLMELLDIYTLAGKYITYAEFKKHCPEIDISQTDWYLMLNGDTHRKNKSELKQRYLNDFENDWNTLKQQAINLISDE